MKDWNNLFSSKMHCKFVYKIYGVLFKYNKYVNGLHIVHKCLHIVLFLFTKSRLSNWKTSKINMYLKLFCQSYR